MMTESCAHEPTVSTAVKSGRWDEETGNHAASCIRCSDIIRTAEWMRSMAVASGWPPSPDPDLLWIEARLLKRQMKRERSMLVFVGLEGVAIALLCALSVRFLPAVFKLSTTSAPTLVALLLAAVPLLLHSLVMED